MKAVGSAGSETKQIGESGNRLPGFRLFTGRYRTFHREFGVPVSITVGLPRWKLGYELSHARWLAPWGLLELADEEEFRRRYRARLHKLTASVIRQRLQKIADERGDDRLVLLCFEDVLAGEACHRRDFAQWWEEKTGATVPEIHPDEPDLDTPTDTPTEPNEGEKLVKRARPHARIELRRRILRKHGEPTGGTSNPRVGGSNPSGGTTGLMP